MAQELIETDEALAKQVQNGQTDKFSELVTRYESKLLRYAGKFLKDSEDKRDLVQNVFLKTYTNLQSFDAERSFSAWIYRIAHNEFINAIKKKGEVVSYWSLDTIFPQPVAKDDPLREVNRKQDRQLLDESLDKLDAKYREPLVLFYYEEKDYDEISEILRIPKATVGIRLKRGRDKLKKMHEGSRI